MNVEYIYSRVAQLSSSELGLDGLPRSLTDTSIGTFLTIAFGIAGGISLVIVAYGALKFVLSQGNPQEVTKAKNTIIDGLIGLAIIASSAGVVGFIIGALR